MPKEYEEAHPGGIRRVPAPEDSATPHDIERLAAVNPTVRAALAPWRRGYVSYEQAMRIAVVALAQQVAAMEKQLLRAEGEYNRLRGKLPPLSHDEIKAIGEAWER